MRKSQQFTGAGLLATLCLLSPVVGLAQDTDATAAPEVSEAPETSEAPEAPSQPYVAQTNGDWEVRCIKVEEGREPCQLYQVLSDPNGGPVAEMVIFPIPEGQQAVAGAIVTTPLETLLTEDVMITVDNGEGRRYPFSLCNVNGCVARIALTAEDIQAYQRGNTAQIRIVPARAPDQEVLLTLSLSGFTASYRALTEAAAN